MIVNEECLKCILSSIAGLGRRVDDAARREAAWQAALRRASELEFSISPPEYAGELYAAFGDCAGVGDLYDADKNEATRLALALLPKLKACIAASDEPFIDVLKAVAGGNIIDFGVKGNLDLSVVERELPEVFKLQLDVEAARKLRRAIDRAERIFYMLDNTGEAVFDRLLLDYCGDKVTLGVRGGAVLNDVTPDDLAASGLAEFPVVDTADRTPGVVLPRSGADFRQALEVADLVIAKGQGNFETLHAYERPIAFLLRVKCPVVARMLELPEGALAVRLANV